MDVAIKFMQKSQSLRIYKTGQNKWKDYEKINLLEGGYLYSCYHQSDFVPDWYRDWVRKLKRFVNSYEVTYSSSIFLIR